MEENLYENFSSVFTRDDISILSVLETKFKWRKFDYLGQLIVTPKMVAMKIKYMTDNKSPGVDRIPPKLLLEIVEFNSRLSSFVGRKENENMTKCPVEG